MRAITITMGALLLAAPLWAQTKAEPMAAKAGAVRWFTFRETPQQVAAALGEPAMVAEAGGSWLSWQYRIGDDVAHEDFSHQLIFERGSGRLLSVTRNYEHERDVRALFPVKQTTLHYFPNAEAPQMALRLRLLPNGLALTALGADGPTSQVVMLRRELLPVYFPWIAPESLTAALSSK